MVKFCLSHPTLYLEQWSRTSAKTTMNSKMRGTTGRVRSRRPGPTKTWSAVSSVQLILFSLIVTGCVFVSVATCPDSLDPVKSGRVMYSTDVVTLNNERRYAVGTTATVVCDSGYRLFGHSVACLAGGAWNCTLSTCECVCVCVCVTDNSRQYCL